MLESIEILDKKEERPLQATARITRRNDSRSSVEAGQADEGVLPESRWKWTQTLALLGALVLAILLFFLVPLTQLLAVYGEKPITIREMSITSRPPPKAPPAPESDPVEPEENPPELQKSFQELTLQQLELALNPGMGDALAMGGSSMAFDSKIDVMEQAQEIFQFSDLEAPPRRISVPRYTFPKSLVRRGVKRGTVKLIVSIDERGRSTVKEIVSSTHPELVQVVRDIVNRSRYTVPKIDGRPVKVNGEFSLTLESN